MNPPRPEISAGPKAHDIAHPSQFKKPVSQKQSTQNRNPAVSTWWDRRARSLVLKGLSKIQQGHLVIREFGHQFEFGQANNRHGLDGETLSATIEIIHPCVYRKLILGGPIGVAEAFMVGDWQTPDLTRVVRVMARNLGVLNTMGKGLAALSKLLVKGFHWLNRNTQSGARKNISAHYDLGNDFFELFLDPTMMYSAGIFPHADASMEEASQFKLDRICYKLGLQPSDHLLEIGTGWGAMAIHAAKHYGCRVTTTTISQKQFDYAKQRIAEQGLEPKITVLFEDYRNLKGQYDKLVSIEMIEAVGHQYYPAYFKQCDALLKPDGLMLLQSITIESQRFERAKNNVDFIKRYIFPGGCLPSTTVILETLTQHTDFNLIHHEDITNHYVKTLACWRKAFMNNLDAVRSLGHDEIFIRMWLFYFCYCEGGFAERAIGDAQMLLAKPENRRQYLPGLTQPVLPQ